MILKLPENRLLPILSLGLFIFFSWLSSISEGAWGGADNYEHYKFSRYAFAHPEFFLDHWGKPLFTLLSSPFSQFGFSGLKVFNVLLGVLSGYFCCRIAQHLGYKNSWLAIVLTCFMPMFFVMMMSGMTEVLFAFVIVFSAFLLLNKRYYLSAIVISFLPFARTEGFVIVPCFFLALLYFRQLKAIPLLAFGTIAYSIVGGFYYDDFFWVISKTPYGDASAIYGSGGFFDFIKAYPEITGIIAGLLFIAGTIAIVVDLFKKEKQKLVIPELLLIVFPVFIYLLFHSFLWWKGMGGSLGLTRVMAGIMPLVALLALRGWNIFDPWLSKIRLIKIVLTAALSFFIIRYTTEFYPTPVPLNPAEQVVKQTCVWLTAKGLAGNKLYYNDPFFVFMLDKDPTDLTSVEQYVPDRQHPENGLATGTVILWDAHFSPNEGGLPLENLLSNPHFELLERFIPGEPFKTLGGYDYEIYVFRKVK